MDDWWGLKSWLQIIRMIRMINKLHWIVWKTIISRLLDKCWPKRNKCADQLSNLHVSSKLVCLRTNCYYNVHFLIIINLSICLNDLICLYNCGGKVFWNFQGQIRCYQSLSPIEEYICWFTSFVLRSYFINIESSSRVVIYCIPMSLQFLIYWLF